MVGREAAAALAALAALDVEDEEAMGMAEAGAREDGSLDGSFAASQRTSEEGVDARRQRQV